MEDHDKTIPGYTRDRKDERRHVPYSNNKMHSPMITWALIGGLLSATVTGAVTYGKLDSLVISNHDKAMTAIQYETNTRLLAGANINENVGEIKDEIKELKKELKEDSAKTQELLRKLLQKQVN